MLHKKTVMLVAALFMCFGSFGVMAKTRMVEVKLLDIESQQLTERTGDELFFTITEYPSKSEPRILRVPIFPLHWLSKDLKNIHNVILWKGKIEDDSSVLLIFSLLEQDAPLVGVDDHIGSAQVKIVNNKGKLVTTWGQPKFVDQPKVEQTKLKASEYLFFGDKGEYAVKFKVNVIE